MKLGMAIVCVCALLSCKKSGSDDLGFASEAIDSTDSSESEGDVLFAAADALPTVVIMKPLAAAAPGEAEATMVAAHAGVYFQPASCVTATAAGNVVTYVLDDCTGPHGRLHMSGTATATITVDAMGSYVVDVAGTGLMVNGATLDLAAHGVFSVSGTTKQVVVTTMGQGVGPRGHVITRGGDYTISWSDTQCRDFDGAWSTDVGGLHWSTTVSGLHRCAGMCPASGTISHTGGISGVTLTITFDGTSTAAWTSSRGRSGTIDLLCGG